MVFFLNEACDTPANDGCLEKLSYCIPPLMGFSEDYHMVIKSTIISLQKWVSGLARNPRILDA